MSKTLYDYKANHLKLMENKELIDYLAEERGLTKETIEKHSLGVLNVYRNTWISIPLFNSEGRFIEGYKLRIDPSRQEKSEAKYICYPKGLHIDCPFNYNHLDFNKKEVIICEGELDCMILDQLGYNALTSNTGANSFKDDYFDLLEPFDEIIILFDNDQTGLSASENLADKLATKYHLKQISIANIPKEEDLNDVTDYVKKYNNIEKVLEKRIKHKGIDISKFEEITIEDIKEALDIVIKGDNSVKITTFLGAVSTYTPESQLNISMTAPSSVGKTYITEIVTRLLPKEDLVSLQYASPKAFFHDYGEYDKERNSTIINLEKKCLSFLDQPSTHILESLRPVLSHDCKEITSKITDKNKQGGNATKNIIIRGYPSLFFCTVNTKMDEQESTRFIMLSPEVSHEKSEAGVINAINSETQEKIEESVEKLKERLMAIKYSDIEKIELTHNQRERVFNFLKEVRGDFSPRDMRDSKKVLYLIHSLALLNFTLRKREGNILYVADSDLEQIFSLWKNYSTTQSYGLQPYLMEVFVKVLIPLFKAKNATIEGLVEGVEDVCLKKNDISNKYFSIYKKILRTEEFNDIMDVFSSLTFIEIGRDEYDGRKLSFKISSEGKKIYDKIYTDEEGGY